MNEDETKVMIEELCDENKVLESLKKIIPKSKIGYIDNVIYRNLKTKEELYKYLKTL